MGLQQVDPAARGPVAREEAALEVVRLEVVRREVLSEVGPLVVDLSQGLEVRRPAEVVEARLEVAGL